MISSIKKQTNQATATAIAEMPIPVPDGLMTPNSETTTDSTTENSPPNFKYELVTWNGSDDPENPQNWPRHSKILRSSAPISIIFSIAFASSIFGSSASVTASEFGVSPEIMSLGVALFIAGFAVGPIVFAPMGELYGSKLVLIVSLTGCAIFQIPLALAQNVPTILICRFLAGTFGAGGLAVGSGILADVFGPITRGIAVGMVATTMNIGSIIGPIVGAFIVDRIGWRWTAWVTLMLCGAVGILCIFNLKESSHNRILMKRAARLRHETGNENLRANAEMISQDPVVLFQKYFTKPVRMFCLEPILIVVTIYLTLVYGSLYLSYQLFPKAFEKRGWSTYIATLPFIAVGLGLVTACGLFAIFSMTWYKRRWVASHRSLEKSEKSEPGVGIQPEDRLPPMILGALLLPPSLIWFGWSGGAHWIVQVIPCFFIGFSLQIIFICGIVYIVDVYLANTVSAISIHVMVRSLVSATFPIFEGPMYDTLHIEYSATLLAGLSALIMISPILLRIYGSRVRSLSRFSG